MTYRTAGYAAEIHPQQLEQLEEQLDKLPDDSPVKVSLGVLLGIDLLVDLKICDQCGSVVHDTTTHDNWHNTSGVR